MLRFLYRELVTRKTDGTDIARPGAARPSPRGLKLYTDDHCTSTRQPRHLRNNFALDTGGISQTRYRADITRRCTGNHPHSGQITVQFCVDIRAQILQRISTTPGHGTEDTALSLLASRKNGANPSELIRVQRPAGGWSEFTSIGPPSAFHTALALLALRPYPAWVMKGAADSGFQWLSELRGRESHWLWQWKFRLFDRQVQFDPSKSGWPWVPDTVSWVGPTALSILAYRAWRQQSARLVSAENMLLDRACPQGGWNAGNSVVFGVSLDPHPDFTAMAVLALRDSIHAQKAIVRRSLDYLANRFDASLSAYSLAWALMALAAYDHAAADHLRTRLEQAVMFKASERPNRILGLAALALEEPCYTFREPTR